MKLKSLAGLVYLVALVQLVLAWLGFSISQQYLTEAPGRVDRGGWEVFAAQHVAFERHRPQALRDVLEWLRIELGIRATLFEPNGRVVASNHDPVPEPIPEAEARALPVREVSPSREPHRYVVGIRDGEELVAYVVTDEFRYLRPLTRQVAFAGALLAIVLAGSLLFARSLVRPLRHLARVARAFGAGQLGARARLSRRDELGEVASAFDDMASRIENLLRSERELLANVSHELRTPLARIRVALDLAAEGDDAAAREALASITADWGDLERLVEDVLATARLDLGSSGAAPPLREDDVDLAALAGAVQERHRLVYPGERLELELESDLPRVRGDGGLLKRVLDNLVDNARKYSDSGSTVRLFAGREPGGVRLAVIDRGMGIDASDLPHVFTPFFRADRSRNRKTGGVGMGLALVRRIVLAHGGRVEVTSRVGEGTRFEVHLPRAVARGAGAGSKRLPELRAAPSARGEKRLATVR